MGQSRHVDKPKYLIDSLFGAEAEEDPAALESCSHSVRVCYFFYSCFRPSTKG